MKLAIVLTFIFSILILNSCSINDTELFNKAQQLVKEKKYNEAIELLKKIVDEKPNGGFGEQSQYAIISLYHSELQNPQQAIIESRKYATLYSENSKTPSVVFMIGFIFNNELKQIDSARSA